MRLWSVVTSQLVTPPRCQAGTCASTRVSAATGRVLLQVARERVDLLGRPAGADGGHRPLRRDPAVSNDLLDGLRVGEERGAGDRLRDPALSGEPVALRADPGPQLLAQR